MWKGSHTPKNTDKIKVLWVVFFNWKGIVYHEYVPRGQMVNKQFYQDFLARFMMLCAGRGLK
jgi:hypothetical protein